MVARIVRAARSERRLDEARAWLAERPSREPLVVIGATPEAGSNLLRETVLRAEPETDTAAAFSWHRRTLGRVAVELAMPAITDRGLTPIGALPREAIVARVLHELGAKGKLGRFAPAVGGPGLPRAVAQSLGELRLAHIEPEQVRDASPELFAISEAYSRALDEARFVDRAGLFRLACQAARSPENEHPLLGLSTLLLDLTVETAGERELLAAIAGRSPDLLATLPRGDETTGANLAIALGADVEDVPEQPHSKGALARLQEHLFEPGAPPPGSLGSEVILFSAPGEGRECVEIARRLHAKAAEGTPFDRMAILLRSPVEYRPRLEEALSRADVPAWFARGSTRPDPAGRAFLALLACAAERLSAHRFAEYLSLGQVPDADAAGQPPAAVDSGERWVTPDEEAIPEVLERLGTETGQEEESETSDVRQTADASSNTVTEGTLRAPYNWERLIHDAAVIGGHDRWARRLEGLDHELALRLAGCEDPEDPLAERLQRDRRDLAALRRFALPLIEALAALPQSANWGDWLEALSELATRGLRRPERVLAVLAELAPMGAIGPIDLDEVRLVLGRRLLELETRAPRNRHGRVFVGPIEAACGLEFDVVFVPGMAERLFPHKVQEDPILLDEDRLRLDADLVTNRRRAAKERLALRLAVGAATRRVVLSYPRLDLQQSRPRVPSFYALEALRAAEGRLPSFDKLTQRAERAAESRIGWPAPERLEEAIDDAEHDLVVLRDILSDNEEESRGAAHYLLQANPHLARALRSRARRWRKRWTVADGLVPGEKLAEGAVEALATQGLAARSFSATALQRFSSCPYRFFLHTVQRLSPREAPEPIDVMDALQRGAFIHEAQHRFFQRLAEAGELPIGPANLEASRSLMDDVLDEVAGRHREKLAPAIERVWETEIEAIRGDLREWIRRMAEDDTGFAPWRFELAFGLPAGRAGDPHSVPDPVELDCGLRLRGSIDLVERRAGRTIRVTDHKTGKTRFEEDEVIRGGEALQPILYALVAERLFPDHTIESGRLSYCTSHGGFEDRVVPLDSIARGKADEVAEIVGGAIEGPFLAAYPAEGACKWCEYATVCGPYEELRTGRKPKGHAHVRAVEKLRSSK